MASLKCNIISISIIIFSLSLTFSHSLMLYRWDDHNHRPIPTCCRYSSWIGTNWNWDISHHRTCFGCNNRISKSPIRLVSERKWPYLIWPRWYQIEICFVPYRVTRLPHSVAVPSNGPINEQFPYEPWPGLDVWTCLLLLLLLYHGWWYRRGGEFGYRHQKV